MSHIFSTTTVALTDVIKGALNVPSIQAMRHCVGNKYPLYVHLFHSLFMSPPLPVSPSFLTYMNLSFLLSPTPFSPVSPRYRNLSFERPSIHRSYGGEQ